MLFETDRLILKMATLSDAPFYFELFNDPDFIRNINDKNLVSVEETKQYLEEIMLPNLCCNGQGFFTVFEKKSNIPIGVSSILKRNKLQYFDIGYAFLPKGRGKGYAVEATKSIMRYANESLKQSKVVAFTIPENTASQRVLKTIGFVYKGLERINMGAKDSVFEFDFNP